MKITIIGAGRVGTAFGERLFEKGFSAVQVFSRDAKRAALLAEKIGAETVDAFEKISPEIDAFLIASPDAAIIETAQKLAKIQPAALAVHFSGATERAVLEPFFEKNGVIWPIQSFSFEKKVDWRRLPLAIESSEKGRTALVKIARKTGGQFFETGAESRAQLHLAATFSNNFSNHLFALVREFLIKKELPFEVLLPLIEATFLNIKTGGDPRLFQTGPAKRGDEPTIRRHLELLENDPELAGFYKLFTKSIRKG